MSITYGINPVREQLKVVSSGSVYFCGGKLSPKLKELETKARASELDVIFLGREEFQKRFGEWEHQGIVLESNTTYSFICSEEDFYNELKDIENTDTVLLLDGVKDVGNLGAILRSALLFNVKYVVLPKNNSASVNEVVIKRSAGAATQLKIVYITNVSRTLEKLKENGYWVYGADMNGKTLDGKNFAAKTVIVMCGEEKGMRRLLRDNCDEMISIPTNEKLDSLNVFVSAAIILYERFRCFK
jgi:23S rRNA (guanosine2251-2'-O)-methyltransferase